MRQAYDYWQDQPGNYFPSKYTSALNERTVLIPNTCHQPSPVTFLVRSSSLIQRAIPTTTSRDAFSWSKTDQPTKQPKAACQTTPSPPISQISGTFHFVAITMQQIVMTFTENYQAPSLYKNLYSLVKVVSQITYLLPSWPSASSPHSFINASILLLDFPLESFHSQKL